jgi:hypothetical protein
MPQGCLSTCLTLIVRVVDTSGQVGERTSEHGCVEPADFDQLVVRFGSISPAGSGDEIDLSSERSTTVLVGEGANVSLNVQRSSPPVSVAEMSRVRCEPFSGWRTSSRETGVWVLGSGHPN